MSEGRRNSFDRPTKIALCPRRKVTVHNQEQLCKTTAEQIWIETEIMGKNYDTPLAVWIEIKSCYLLTCEICGKLHL